MNSPLHVLHLEDDDNDAHLVQLELENEEIDCRIIRVETGEKFAASLANDRIDIILADYSLPSFDGLKALQLVKDKHPDIPFIFVSGAIGEDIAIESLKNGATDYVLKDRLSRLVPSLRRALDEYEERRDRKRAEEELFKKNRDLETILYVTSHDLREPLRAIQTFSRMVHNRYADQLDEKGQDFLKRIVRATKRLDDLLDDVLLLSRAQSIGLQTEFVDGNSILSEVLKRLDSGISESQADIRVEGELPSFRVDRTWAIEALYNLIANALKFTSEGIAPQITIAPFQENHEAGIMVKDRGPGVDPGQTERIFQLFQRGVGREIEGTGLGLAIVRLIAERHQGKTWVRPRQGGGSEFIITFGVSKTKIGSESHAHEN